MSLQAGPGDADGHPGDQRAGVVERLHDARRSRPWARSPGSPSRFSLGTRQSWRTKLAVSEARMPSLCSSRSSLRPGLSRSTTKRLDRGAALRAVERRPHDDQLGPVTRGDVDLLAVEDVLLGRLVELGGGADRRRVRAGLGLGDRHRRPLAAEALELLLVGDGGDRRLAEALAGHRQQQADVAPAQLDQPEQAGHVGAVAVPPASVCLGRPTVEPFGCRRRPAPGAAERRRPRSCRRSAPRACRAPWGTRARRCRTCASWGGGPRWRPGGTGRPAGRISWELEVDHGGSAQRAALPRSGRRRAGRGTSARRGAP